MIAPLSRVYPPQPCCTDVNWPPCVHCDAKATQFLDASDPYDPVCDACYAKLFDPCGTCDRWQPKTDIFPRQVSRATRMEPAEYQDGCPFCCPEMPDEPDTDRLEEV